MILYIELYLIAIFKVKVGYIIFIALPFLRISLLTGSDPERVFLFM